MQRHVVDTSITGLLLQSLSAHCKALQRADSIFFDRLHDGENVLLIECQSSASLALFNSMVNHKVILTILVFFDKSFNKVHGSLDLR